MAERPDDSGVYDDATLLDIIAERFSVDSNPITRRDGAWVCELARRALESRAGLPMTRIPIITLQKALRQEYAYQCQFAPRMTASARAAQGRRIRDLRQAIEILKREASRA